MQGNARFGIRHKHTCYKQTSWTFRLILNPGKNPNCRYVKECVQPEVSY